MFYLPCRWNQPPEDLLCGGQRQELCLLCGKQTRWQRGARCKQAASLRVPQPHSKSWLSTCLPLGCGVNDVSDSISICYNVVNTNLEYNILIWWLQPAPCKESCAKTETHEKRITATPWDYTCSLSPMLYHCLPSHLVQSRILQASLQLTESQKIGMMQVRRLFYAKLGAIRRQRQKLLQQVPLRPTAAASEASYDASSRLSGIALSAQQLQVNTDAELRAYLHVSAFLRLSTEGNQGQGVSHRVVGDRAWLCVSGPLLHSKLLLLRLQQGCLAI